MLSFFVVYEISRITVDYIARCLCLQWRRKISIGGGGGGLLQYKDTELNFLHKTYFELFGED